jgi:predicted ferric reductase
MVYGKTHISYETWKKVHFAGFFVFPLAFLHSFLIGTTVQRGPMPLFWLVLLLLYLWAIFNRINRRYKLRRNPFTVRTVSKEAEKIWSLHFKGSHKGFSPGQFMLARLVRNGRVSEPHPFTIASEPTEKSLSICVKEVGDFTNAIGGTTSNDTAYIDMPYGVFSFHYHDNERLVFIAGGIGITPFMSMLRDIYARKLKKRVTLLWGIKTEKEIVFRDELDRMASELEGFKVVYVLSRQENWQGEKGRIGRSVLEKHVERFHEGEFFLCGPPSMMKDVKKIIKDLGVSRKRIQTENFALR